jgi:hypothetical protein
MKIQAGLFSLAAVVLPCVLFAQAFDAPVEGAEETARTPQTAIQSWPTPTRTLARRMISKYGVPDRFGEHALYWYDNGPWRRTVVYRDSLTRSFLRKNKDFLEQSVGYQVSVDDVETLKRFDKGVGIDANTGELTSRSESEALNFLALNLAVEILTHARSVDDARDFYRKTRRLALAGKSSPYFEGLAFEVQTDKDVNHWNP